MNELMTTATALRLAEAVEFPELAEALRKAADDSVDFVNVVPEADGVAVEPHPGVMVAWMLPGDVNLAVEGGEGDHHVTLVYLGDAADLDEAQKRQIIGVTAEVCQRHTGLLGTIGGTGTFENEETVWWAAVQIEGLAELQADLASSLAAAGLPVHDDHGGYTPHVTLAYLPAGEEPPSVDVMTVPVEVNQLTVAIGGTRFDLPLQDIAWDEVADEAMEMPMTTPFIPSVTKGLGDVDPETQEEWRYTLGPVYMPGMVDAHGDSIDADDLERAIHDYVRTGDRRIRLQHNTEVVAGEWVGLLVWPWPVTVPVLDEGQLVQRTFPAGTPFMGVVWKPAVWELVKAGAIRGYSLGGMAEFVTVELGEGDADPKVQKGNPYHGTDGRFTSGPGGGGVSMEAASVSRGRVRAARDRHSPSLDADRDVVYQHAKANGKPGTLDDAVTDVRTPDGGFTYDPRSGKTVGAGFAVSPFPERSQMINVQAMDDEAVAAAIHDYGQKNADLLKKKGNMLGGWHDPQGEKPGTVYLDVSVVTDSAEKARKIAAEKDQLSFFDFQFGESVDVDRNATSGGQVAKGNPYHGKDGRFTSGPGGGGGITPSQVGGGHPVFSPRASQAVIDDLKESSFKDDIDLFGVVHNDKLPDEVRRVYVQAGMDVLAEREHKVKQRDEMVGVMQDYVDKGDIAVRMDPRAAKMMLEDGRFKSQFEVGASNGFYSPKTRADAEAVMFNAPMDLPDAQRPIYGYIAGPGGDDEWGTQQYGSVRVILKDDVRARTTVTFGDSLSGHTMLPSPATAVDKYSINPGELHGDTAKASMEALKFGSYVEAQMHGGLSVSDIARIDVLDVSPMDESFLHDITAMADQAGIEVRL